MAFYAQETYFLDEVAIRKYRQLYIAVVQGDSFVSIPPGETFVTCEENSSYKTILLRTSSAIAAWLSVSIN